MADVYNSRLAKILAYLHKEKNGMAFVIGQTAYYSVPKERVSERWRNHEDRHKEQYKELGIFKFLVMYWYYSLKYGYHNNPFEVDARNHEVKRIT